MFTKLDKHFINKGIECSEQWFDDKMELALFYKGKAEHYKTLFDEGIEHTVNF